MTNSFSILSNSNIIKNGFFNSVNNNIINQWNIINSVLLDTTYYVSPFNSVRINKNSRINQSIKLLSQAKYLLIFSAAFLNVTNLAVNSSNKLRVVIRDDQNINIFEQFLPLLDITRNQNPVSVTTPIFSGSFDNYIFELNLNLPNNMKINNYIIEFINIFDVVNEDYSVYLDNIIIEPNFNLINNGFFINGVNSWEGNFTVTNQKYLFHNTGLRLESGQTTSTSNIAIPNFMKNIPSNDDTVDVLINFRINAGFLNDIIFPNTSIVDTSISLLFDNGAEKIINTELFLNSLNLPGVVDGLPIKPSFNGNFLAATILPIRYFPIGTNLQTITIRITNIQTNQNPLIIGSVELSIIPVSGYLNNPFFKSSDNPNFPIFNFWESSRVINNPSLAFLKDQNLGCAQINPIEGNFLEQNLSISSVLISENSSISNRIPNFYPEYSYLLEISAAKLNRDTNDRFLEFSSNVANITLRSKTIVSRPNNFGTFNNVFFSGFQYNPIDNVPAVIFNFSNIPILFPIIDLNQILPINVNRVVLRPIIYSVVPNNNFRVYSVNNSEFSSDPNSINTFQAVTYSYEGWEVEGFVVPGDVFNEDPNSSGAVMSPGSSMICSINSLSQPQPDPDPLGPKSGISYSVVVKRAAVAVAAPKGIFSVILRDALGRVVSQTSVEEEEIPPDLRSVVIDNIFTLPTPESETNNFFNFQLSNMTQNDLQVEYVDISLTTLQPEFFIICYSGETLINVKDIETDKIELLPVKKIKSDKHLVQEYKTDKFIPIKYNIVTSPTDEFILFKQNVFEENKPSEDLYITPGHLMLYHDKIVKAKKIPEGIKVKTELKQIYSICTNKSTIILANNIPVTTWGLKKWEMNCNERNIKWKNN